METARIEWRRHHPLSTAASATSLQLPPGGGGGVGGTEATERGGFSLAARNRSMASLASGQLVSEEGFPRVPSYLGFGTSSSSTSHLSTAAVPRLRLGEVGGEHGIAGLGASLDEQDAFAPLPPLLPYATSRERLRGISPADEKRPPKASSPGPVRKALSPQPPAAWFPHGGAATCTECRRCDSLKQELVSLKKELLISEAAVDACATLRSPLSRAKEAYETEHRRCHELEEELKRLRQDHDKQRVQTQQQLETLRLQNDKVKKEREALVQEKEELRKAADIRGAHLKQQETCLALGEENFRRVRGELINVLALQDQQKSANDGTLQELRGKLLAAEVQRDHNAAQLERARQIILDLEHQLTRRTEEMQRIKTEQHNGSQMDSVPRIQELSVQWELVEAEREAQASEMEHVQRARDLAEQQLAERDDELRMAMQEIAQARTDGESRLEELRTQIASLTLERDAAMKEARVEKTQAQADVSNRLEDLRRETSQLAAERDAITREAALYRKLAEDREEILSLQKGQLQDKDEKYTLLQGEWKRLQEEQQQLQHQLRQKQQELLERRQAGSLLQDPYSGELEVARVRSDAAKRQEAFNLTTVGERLRKVIAFENQPEPEDGHSEDSHGEQEHNQAPQEEEHHNGLEKRILGSLMGEEGRHTKLPAKVAFEKVVAAAGGANTAGKVGRRRSFVTIISSSRRSSRSSNGPHSIEDSAGVQAEGEASPTNGVPVALARRRMGVGQRHHGRMATLGTAIGGAIDRVSASENEGHDTQHKQRVSRRNSPDPASVPLDHREEEEHYNGLEKRGYGSLKSEEGRRAPKLPAKVALQKAAAAGGHGSNASKVARRKSFISSFSGHRSSRDSLNSQRSVEDIGEQAEGEASPAVARHGRLATVGTAIHGSIDRVSSSMKANEENGNDQEQLVANRHSCDNAAVATGHDEDSKGAAGAPKEAAAAADAPEEEAAAATEAPREKEKAEAEAPEEEDDEDGAVAEVPAEEADAAAPDEYASLRPRRSCRVSTSSDVTSFLADFSGYVVMDLSNFQDGEDEDGDEEQTIEVDVVDLPQSRINAQVPRIQVLPA